MSVALLIPAAGSGRRLGLSVPKAVADVGGRSLLARTIEGFRGTRGLTEVVVAVPRESADLFDRAVADVELEGCTLRTVVGGATRQDSVRLALGAVGPSIQLVAVHDAARPLAGRPMLESVLAATERDGAATVVSRPADSVREIEQLGGHSSKAVDRERLRLVGTPQAFRRELLSRAHERGLREKVEVTDDASLVERCEGASVSLVERDELNLKVTRPHDLELIRLIFADLSGRESRR